MMKYGSWFYKKGSVKKLWVISILLLSVVVLIEFFIKLHGYFSIVDFFAFNALFGFLSCILMVVFAKLLGFVIKRKQDYYEND